MRTHLPAILVALVVLSCGRDDPPPPPPPDAGPTCSSGTTIVYRDADGDAYGDANSAGVTICAGSVLAGHVANRLDCGDGDARANPAAGPAFQTTAISGIAANPWDFNCDGAVTVQYPSARRLCFGTSLCASANNTWRGDPGTPPPLCGVSDAWIVDCRFSVSQCVAASVVTRTQGCF